MKLLKWSKCPLWLQSCGRILITISVVISLMVVALYILHLIDPEWLKFIHFNTEAALKGEWITSFHGLSIVLLTVGIIAVAWYQLTRLNKISKADFLLNLDRRYCSGKILEARRILVELGYSRYNCSHDFHEEMEKIVKNRGNSKDRGNSQARKEASKKYILLLNLLDFLEAISYYKDKNYLLERDFNELFGKGILPSYRRAFRTWLSIFRDEEPNRYSCLIKLTNESDE